MENPNSRVESYVPTAEFYEEKSEMAGKLFGDRFAVVDRQNDFAILAFRGENLAVGQKLPFDREWCRFLEQKLASGKRVMIPAEGGTALFFGDWNYAGLLPVLLFDAPASELAAAVELMPCGGEIALPEGLNRQPGEARRIHLLCRDFAASLSSCERVFGAMKTHSFRQQVARIAEFAGCRGNFEGLSAAAFPLTFQDLRKWTILLLCLFLSLRGASEKMPACSMREIGRNKIFGGIDFYPSQGRKSEENRFPFLCHPAFADVELQGSKGELRLSVLLSQKSENFALQAQSEQIKFSFLLEIA